jgi:hypothetical protein
MRFFALRSSSPSVSKCPPIPQYSTVTDRTTRSLEYPDLKVFSVHPGIVATELTAAYEGKADRDQDSPALCAATILYLISGRADYLSGRYAASTWDLGEVERDWKEKIISHDALVSKLDIPQ